MEDDDIEEGEYIDTDTEEEEEEAPPVQPESQEFITFIGDGIIYVKFSLFKFWL